MKDFKYLDNLIHRGLAEIMLNSDIILAEGEESIYGEGIKLDMEKVTIDGKGHTIDAKSLAGIFHSNSKGITLKNITFRNSTCAIYNDEGEMRMENCRFIENASRSNGAAIHNYKGIVDISQCRFIQNSAKMGGAICNYRAQMTIRKSKFRKNHAEFFGGAIYSAGDDVKLISSQLSENTADIGGGIFSGNGNLIIHESLLNQNTAKIGGGIHNEKSLTVLKSKLNENMALEYGGAIHSFDGRVNIRESEIIENSAEKHGAGIFSNNPNYEFESCIIEDEIHEIANFIQKGNDNF